MRGSRELLRQVIGIVLVAYALTIAFSRRLRAGHTRLDEPSYLGFAGTAVAAVMTATGVGIGSPSVSLLYFTKGCPQMAAVLGTSLIHTPIVTAIAALGNVALGNVNYRLAALLLCGALPGVVLGSVLASRASAALHPIVAALVAASGTRLMPRGSSHARSLGV